MQARPRAVEAPPLGAAGLLLAARQQGKARVGSIDHTGRQAGRQAGRQLTR